MVRIAILFCGTTKNELGCPAGSCISSFTEKTGAFSRYGGEEIELVGFGTCAGCPTLVGPEKILRSVKPLVEISKAEKLHLSSCMTYLCPFVAKYKEIIAAAYPQLEVVPGTEANGDEHLELTRKFIKKLLVSPCPDISDEYGALAQSEKYESNAAK